MCNAAKLLAKLESEREPVLPKNFDELKQNMDSPEKAMDFLIKAGIVTMPQQKSAG